MILAQDTDPHPPRHEEPGQTSERTDDLADRLQSVVRRLAALSLRAETEAAARARIPVHTLEFAAIKHIGEIGSVQMRCLSNHLHLPPSSATGLIDKLAEKGLVERVRKAEDRRIIQISLTPKGRDAWNAVSERHLDFCRDALNSFRATERTQLVDVVSRLTAACNGSRPKKKKQKSRTKLV